MTHRLGFATSWQSRASGKKKQKKGKKQEDGQIPAIHGPAQLGCGHVSSRAGQPCRPSPPQPRSPTSPTRQLPPLSLSRWELRAGDSPAEGIWAAPPCSATSCCRPGRPTAQHYPHAPSLREGKGSRYGYRTVITAPVSRLRVSQTRWQAVCRGGDLGGDPNALKSPFFPRDTGMGKAVLCRSAERPSLAVAGGQRGSFHLRSTGRRTLCRT